MITFGITLYLYPATFAFSVVVQIVQAVTENPLKSDYAKRMAGDPE